MITPRDTVPEPLTVEQSDAVANAEAQVTAETLVPEAFPDEQQIEPGFTGEQQQTASLVGKGVDFVSDLIPGKKLREALSPQPKAPGIAGNATEDEAVDLLSQQTQVGRVVDPARTSQRNISLKYIDGADDIQQMLDDIAVNKDITADPVMQPQSWAETQTKAIEAETDLRQIFGNDFKAPENAGEIIAMRDLMTESSSELIEMADSLLMVDPASGLKTFRGDVSADEMFNFRKSINAHTAIQAHFMRQTKEVGRMLNALKMPNGSPQMPMEQLLEASDPANLRQLAALISDAKDPAGVAGATRAHWARRTGGMMYEYWINNLLGSVGTHTKNMIGNTMTSVMALPEHYAAGGIGALRKIAGMGVDDSVSFREVNAMAYGMWQGLGDGLSAGMRRLAKDQGEMGLIDPQHTKMEYFRRPQFTAANMALNEDGLLGRSMDFIGKWYVRLPGRFLEAEDELFRSVGYRMELNRTTFATAQKEGFAPGTREFYDRVNQLVKEPPQELHADAVNFSRYQTFTNELTGDTAEAAKLFQRTPLGKFMVPFLRTPLNILKYGMARTPVGFAMPSVLKDLKAGGPLADLALSRITLGSTIAGTMVASSNFYDEDGKYRPVITGAGPDNPDMAALWRSYGILPYSKYDEDTGKYVPYDIMEPYGTVLATMATGIEILNHTHDPEKKQEVISAMVLGLAEYTTEKAYMQGITHLMDMLRGRGVGKVATNIATSLSPTSTVFMSRLARDIDSTKRETKDVPPMFGSGLAVDKWLAETFASIKAKTPGLSGGLKPRTDVFGVDIVFDEPIFFYHSISPGMAGALKSDSDAPYARELVANNIGERRPTPVVRFQSKYGLATVDLLRSNALDGKGEPIPGDTMFYNFRKMVGGARVDQIIKVMGTDYYRNLPDQSPERAHQLSAAMDRGLEIGQNQLRQKYPDLVVNAINEAEEKSTQSLPAGLPASIANPPRTEL